MKKKSATVLYFGKKRKKDVNTPPNRSAEFALVCGVITMGVFFFGTLTGGVPSAEGKNFSPSDAVPVMTEITEEIVGQEKTVRETLRKTVRDAAVLNGEPFGEPFGYVDGKWNLWEYLGDMMAALLLDLPLGG